MTRSSCHTWAWGELVLWWSIWSLVMIRASLWFEKRQNLSINLRKLSILYRYFSNQRKALVAMIIVHELSWFWISPPSCTKWTISLSLVRHHLKVLLLKRKRKRGGGGWRMCMCGDYFYPSFHLDNIHNLPSTHCSWFSSRDDVDVWFEKEVEVFTHWIVPHGGDWLRIPRASLQFKKTGTNR